MLKRNKNVEVGFVNGSVGTVVEFTVTTAQGTGSHVAIIKVKFDKNDCAVNITREAFSFEVLKSVFYTRQQFPLMAAFAITIHKSQGLSLISAIVDAGKAAFGPGMIYVGLSRVTKLSGIRLVDICRGNNKCDKKTLTEYNRLRYLYLPHLGTLGDLSGDAQHVTENTTSSTEMNELFSDQTVDANTDHNTVTATTSTEMNGLLSDQPVDTNTDYSTVTASTSIEMSKQLPSTSIVRNAVRSPLKSVPQFSKISCGE
jgi:Helicase